MIRSVRAPAIAMVLASSLAFSTPSRADDAAANALFVQAVQTLQQARGSDDLSAQLAAIDTALASFDQIVSEHPSSSIAVSLITGQAIGDVDVNALRAQRDVLTAEIAEDQAQQQALDAQQQASDAWVEEAMLCAESLSCVDEMFAEALGEPFLLPSSERDEFISSLYNEFVERLSGRMPEMGDEEASAFEKDGFDPSSRLATRYIRYLALRGDPRVPELVVSGPRGSLIEDFVLPVAEGRGPETGTPISLAIHALVTEGPAAALLRISDVRQANAELLQQFENQDPGSGDARRVHEIMVEALQRLQQDLVAEFLIVLSAYNLNQGLPYDEDVARRALRMMLQDLGRNNGSQWGTREGYAFLAYFVASYGLRSAADPDAPLSSSAG